MIPDDPAQDDDDRWQALEDRADELTEQNRVELTALVQKDRDLFIKAFVSMLDNDEVSHEQLAELIWDERQCELSDYEDRADKTPMALLFRQAGESYAKDWAERVTPEQLDAARRDEYVEIDE